MSHRGSHIGTLIKPHGFKGELLMKGKPEILRKLQEGMPLFIELSGQRIPFFIEEISHDPSGEKCMIQLEFIDSDNVARRYAGCEVFDHPELQSGVQAADFRPQAYVGFIVIDIASRDEYRVKDFFDHPGNPILLLERHGHEVMLPARADYILSVDISEKVIKADFPEGLVIS